MTEDFSEGPFTKDEVITLLRTLLGSEYDAEEDCYECYGFNCILDFYEMSGGYYCESHILTRPNRYSLYRCCARYGSIEDKRRFNRNVVWAGEMSLDHLLPTNNKERAALRKAWRRMKKSLLYDCIYKFSYDRICRREKAQSIEKMWKYIGNGQTDASLEEYLQLFEGREIW